MNQRCTDSLGLMAGCRYGFYFACPLDSGGALMLY